MKPITSYAVTCLALVALTAMTSAAGCKGASSNGPEGSQRIDKLDFECASMPVNKYMYYYVDRESGDPKAKEAAKAPGCDDKGSLGIPNDATHTTYKNCFCCAKP